MEFIAKSGHPENQRTGCLVIPIFENSRLSPSAKEIDTLTKGVISELLKSKDIEGKLGQSLLLYALPNIQASRVLILGCGNESQLSDNAYREVVRRMMASIIQTGTQDVICMLPEINIEGRDTPWKIRQIVEITLDALYKFDSFKSKKDESKRPFNKMHFFVPSRKELRAAEQALLEGQAIAGGVELAKNLGNTPANVCTPTYLAKEAEKLAKQYSHLSVAVLSEKDIQALKMGSFLSVAQGSKNPPKLITLEYRGRKDKQKPVVLVGKGITFDTGGNSIKPAANMIGMKYDMCGAAAVLGILKSAAELELPINLVGVIPAAENMPGNEASRPEDIVTSMSGQTIEILNTDAEGRLVLCDALTYSERFNPDVVIDMATLTGACIVALGRLASALMSNHQPLADDLLAAGNKSGDRCWQLPIWEEYQESINSHYADMANIGVPGEAGTIIGGCFLARFTKNFHWAHLDVANTATRRDKDRGATGRPIPLVMQYLIDRCKA